MAVSISRCKLLLAQTSYSISKPLGCYIYKLFGLTIMKVQSIWACRRAQSERISENSKSEELSQGTAVRS